ncbi:MAG: GxxExxY protein [Bacteroidetes bacterium]|nr:GxxExxY protein [Bacteroidota bacterium]
MEKQDYDRISSEIMSVCIAVHREMGPGLLESVYEMCLMKEFELRGIKAKNQVTIPLMYKGFELSKEFKIDILVEDEIILELKSADHLIPVFEAQLISYLRLTNKKLGYLINFNVPLVKSGIKRFVHNF